MNAAERLHAATRRGQTLKDKEALLNGAGLALSGGGIRSATFCLGVVQVLAGAKLLAKFDYLSTVSGGGYLGAFLSNQFDEHDVANEKAPIQSLAAGASAAYDGVFPKTSADSPAVRHLRNSSKYLLPTTTFAPTRSSSACSSLVCLQLHCSRRPCL